MNLAFTTFSITLSIFQSLLQTRTQNPVFVLKTTLLTVLKKEYQIFVDSFSLPCALHASEKGFTTHRKPERESEKGKEIQINY